MTHPNTVHNSPPPPPPPPSRSPAASTVFAKPHALASSWIPVSVLVGIVLYAALMGALVVLHRAGVSHWAFTFIHERLLLRGSIPHIMTIGFTIGLAMLIVRLPLLTREYHRLRTWEPYLTPIRHFSDESLEHVPGGPGRTLTDSVIQQIVHRSSTAENRAEMDAMVDQITSVERRKLDASHVPVRYLIWLIPTLGFLGTVLGISLAVSGFSTVITNNQGETDMNASLVEICNELGVAFDTTFVALIYSAIIALLMAYVDRRELSLLNTLDEFYALAIRPRLVINTNPYAITEVSATPEDETVAHGYTANGPGTGGTLVVLQTPGDENGHVNLHDMAQQIVAQSLASLAEQGQQMSTGLADAATGAHLRHFIDANLLHMKEQINWMQSSAITRDDLNHLSENFAAQAARLQEMIEREAQRQSETSAVLDKLTAVVEKLHAEGVAANISINSVVSAPGNA